MLKVQNTFPIKDDFIHCSIVLYKKENSSYSKDKIRNRSLLDNKSDFNYKRPKNKRRINIRININNNKKNYFKLKDKPLAYSTSVRKSFIKIKNQHLEKSTDNKTHKKIKKTKNNSVQYKNNNSIVNFKKNNLNITNNNNNINFGKTYRNKKNEMILKKRKYGEMMIDNNNLKKKNEIYTYKEQLDKTKENSTKNKNNNIIIYNNLFKNEKSRKHYNKIEKHKIETSINKAVNLDKINLTKNNSHSKRRNNNENSKINNNVSNLSKRKSYIVPSIKVKKRKIEEKVKEKEKEKEKENINENILYNKENKQIFVSHLIESKQIEYLKDFEKYKNDCEDKLIKNNEKKIRAINDENIIDKILTSDEENKDTREDNEELSDKKENKDNKDKKESYKNKNNDYALHKKNKSNVDSKNININESNIIDNSKFNNYKIINNIENDTNNEDMKDSIEEYDHKNNNINNINITNNYNINNIENNNILIYNIRKPKINSLEYIYRINNNIDINKLITSLSYIDNSKNNIENMDNNIKNSEPESQSSVNILYKKNYIRPKEEINDFMKNNRLKLKISEIKLKKEKKDEILKKFKNYVELQKKIEENKKLKYINNIKVKYEPKNNDKNKIEDKSKKNFTNEFHASQKSSVSTILNLQEFYLSIYDTQKIYSSQERDRKLLKNYSMIVKNNIDDKLLKVPNEITQNINKGKNQNDNIDVDINKKKENGKKFDNNAIKKIKKVISRLNDFLNDKKSKNIYSKTNYIKGKRDLISDYDCILKNVNKFIKQKRNNKSKKSESKKAKIKDKDLFIIKKQIPINTRNFKKISMNEIKKLINHSQNNLYTNKQKLNKSNDNIKIDSSSKEKKNLKILIKNYSGIINKNKPKVYKFTDRQLNKYKEIFNYLFDYIKLLFQKNIFNIIILYVNIKNKYIFGLNQIVIFCKKRPFNYLRIIQQRAYYEVILRQFYLPYIIRAFNSIKQYIINRQKIYDANNIIKHIYFEIFIKRLLFFIEMKENYMNKYDYEKIIEEEKEDISDSNENKIGKININNNLLKINNINNNENINNDIKNSDKEIYMHENKINNINSDSLNKNNSESFDEIKIITNTFNTIINNISISPKIYVFDLFKKYYLESKNKSVININNAYKNINKDNNIEIENKYEIKLLNKYNTYVYESLTEKSEISAFPNSERDDRTHNAYTLLGQNKNMNINNKQIESSKNTKNRNNEFKLEQISHQNEINSNDKNNQDDNEELIDFNNLSMNDSEGEQIINQKSNEKKKFITNENSKKEEMSLFMPYKGEVKKNLMSNLIKSNVNKKDNKNKNEIKGGNSEDINSFDKILKNEFKRYEQSKDSINAKDGRGDLFSYNNKINRQNIENNIINNKDQRINSISSSEEIVFPLKNLDMFLNNQEENDNEINSNIYEKAKKNNDINSLYFNLSKNFDFKPNDEINNKRYRESDELLDNGINEEDKKLLRNIPKDIEEKLAVELTNEIINNLLKIEIENKDNLLTYKKDSKRPSNSSITAVVNKESKSSISRSPGRKFNKTNNNQNLVNNNESYTSVNNSNKNSNILDEEDLNNSIFKRTVYEIKKDIEIKYYEKNIFPKLLNLFEKNINKNYIKILNNLKLPLKKNDKEVMEDLSNLITYETMVNNEIIRYKSNFINKEIVKFEYIDKKILEDFNHKLSQIKYFKKYNYEDLNLCIYDTTNEIIKSKRMYQNVGEPLLWSLRNRKLEYEYKNTKLFRNMFVSNIIKEIKKLYFSKIGDIIENSENLNISQFSKERDIKYNKDIKEDLKNEKEFELLDEQETVIKITISKAILYQLLNEVIEILEHINYSRKEPEIYNYKSIFSCDNIPLLSFQKNKKDDGEDQKFEDNINL